MGTTRTYVPTDLFGKPIGKPVQRTSHDQPDDSAVPEGSIAVVRKWVGYDPDRAKAALLHEHASDRPRKGLVEALDPIVKEG